MPGDTHLLPADGRCAAAEHGRAHWARHYRYFPGQGQIRRGGVLRAGAARRLHRSAVAGDLQRRVPRDAQPPHAVDAMRSLLLLESEVRARGRRTPATTPAARALQRRALFDAAADAALQGHRVHGVRGRRRRGGVARQPAAGLGFARAGRHRSKPVTLYRQGDIHLVVNRLGHAAARERFEAYGPSVCALALRTADADAALQRATALQSARFDPPRGPGEQALPSIVAPGGTILHFVPDSLGPEGLYEGDFSPRTTPMPATAACARSTTSRSRSRPTARHLGAVLPRGAGPGARREPRSWPIRSGWSAASAWPTPAAALRLVLNVSQSQRTRTARR